MPIMDNIAEEIESLKEEGKFDEALDIVNHLLTKNPRNEDALLQIADIQYRKGDLEKATKAIDFLNDSKDHADPMALYVKGVLEMEKNNRLPAKKYLKSAVQFTEFENHEILRCYGLCEYRYGNREKGITFLESAFDINNLDAEVIYNMIELYLLEHKYAKAKKMIAYYYSHRESLLTFDKDLDYYDHKINLFESFIKNYKHIFERQIL